MLTCLRPPTIARQAEAGRLFGALRTAIDAYLLDQELQSVKAIVGAVVTAQQQQAERIDALEQQNGEQAEQIGALQQQVHGLRQHQDEEKEKGEVVRERVAFELIVQPFDDTVQAPSTGTAVAGSGSASQPTAATGPAAAPASPASPASPAWSEGSGGTVILTPTIASPPQPEAGELDQAPTPVPPPVSAPAPAVEPTVQMHHHGQPLSPVKASPNSPAHPAAAGATPNFLTPTQHVESPILVVPQPATLASSGVEVSSGLLGTGAASELLGSRLRGCAKVAHFALSIRPGQGARRCACLRPTSPPATPH